MATVLARSLLALMAIGTAAGAAPLLVTVPAPPSGIPPRDLGGSTIYLNRCVGGCAVHVGNDNSATDTSAIPKQDSFLPEYTGFAVGEWEAVVQCVKEVYSPYNVNIVDARPASGDYGMIFVGGAGTDIQTTQAGVGGVALLTRDCSPSSKTGVAFAFTDQINTFANEDGGSRVNGLCWIVAQETAHIYGLDHEFAFVDDNSSACNDPMTYRADCGGQKFFRNRTASCGEFTMPRSKCGPTNQCAATQNSHQALTTLFGPHTPIFGPPVVTLVQPAAMTLVGANYRVIALASAPRGISRIELWLNGFQWGPSVKGVAFAANGQPEINYSLPIPPNLPDSIVDLTVKAFDDIGGEGDSATVTVTKGTACVDATTCATGQKCAMGRCFWDPPTLELGEACTFDQACKSLLCTGTDTQSICTHACLLADPMACEAGLACTPTSDTQGVCFFPDNSGCCSVGPTSTMGTLMRLGLALGALGVMLRRRRRA